ncbi:his Kinase A domain protein [Ralstonia insidiosa]|uniref:histidine kinase n=1 Tax=Ralstonia insidiosa TaxID=190721 RepID=A0AAC9BJT8_9RALS|nr:MULTISPECIES: sensor histidine kinase [Ralstonia]ANH75441.1 his Kinase A domain protein [Ralstonia insidiosa]EPX99445.1 membrane protein [Ralstonia sp. AU12-08]
MYALFPAFVSSLFLFYGAYVLTTRGRTRASIAFFGMTVLTCLWQGIWAFLFQTHDIGTAQVLAKLGWIAILVMPTMLYHFAVEVAESPNEQRWLIGAYALDAALIALLMTTNLVIDGVQHFHFGFYPKAGPLEVVHIVETTVLVSRGMWLLYLGQQHATAEKRKRLLTCLFGVGLISLSAVDYAVNYGAAFYPPGVLPLAVAVALGIIAVGVVKFDLMRPYALAATVAHEVRTPLTTIRLQAAEIARAWPDLYRGYQLAIDNGLCQPPAHPAMLERVSKLAGAISSEVASAHSVIEMALASVTLERLDRRTFAAHSLRECVEMAVAQYPFQAGERERVHVQEFNADWRFLGSDTLLMYVLFNLLKNALHAIQIARKGQIEITARQEGDSYVLAVRDSATGIPPSVQRRIFDPFFSTKHVGKGSGVGLTFCRRVMQAFGGRIHCESVVGEYTLFSMRFPQPPAI